MPIADKVIALLDGMTLDDIERMAPARRRQLAALCRHWAALIEPPATDGRRQTGVLADLRRGVRPD